MGWIASKTAFSYQWMMRETAYISCSLRYTFAFYSDLHLNCLAWGECQTRQEVFVGLRRLYFAGPVARIGAGVTSFSWSRDAKTLCHFAGSFLVSRGRERSE